MKENQLSNWRHVNGRIRLDADWFDRGLLANVNLHSSSFIDSSYGFAQYYSDSHRAFEIDKARPRLKGKKLCGNAWISGL